MVHSLDDAERYREYLKVLAQVQIGQHLQAKVDASDVVQQTLWEAHKARDRFESAKEKDVLAYLRVVLAHNIADAARNLGKAVAERSLQADLEKSSKNLEAWLAADQTSPSQGLRKQEQIVRLSNALAQLPEKQREVLLLRHCRGWSLADISARLGCKPPSVVGLLKRASSRLRELLDEGE